MDSFFSPLLAPYAYHVSSNSDFYGTPGGMAGFSGATMLGLLLLLGAGLIGFIVQQRMMHFMNTYSQEPAPYTGAEVARRMLEENGITDVRVISTPGQLTDHYNPVDKTVNLSETVYNQATVAAMAVAAHECGHALQHARAYSWLTMRTALVPLVGIGSRLGQIVLIIGLLMVGVSHDPTVAWIGLALFGTTTLFALVTLPVEFNASMRALAWMNASGIADRAMHGQAATALRWAAMTYVSAALSSIAALAYYAIIILSRSAGRRD